MHHDLLGLGYTNRPSQNRRIGVFATPRKLDAKICGIYEHDLMDSEMSVDENVGEPVYNCMSCSGWWHESCMSATDRQTLTVRVDNECGRWNRPAVEMSGVCEEG